MDGYEIKSILKNKEKEVNVKEKLVELDEVDINWEKERSNELEYKEREKEIKKKIRLENIKKEERKLMVKKCLD